MDDLNNPHYKLAKSVFDFKVRNNYGQIVPLKQYEGYVNIFVNVASKSRFTEYMFGLLNDAYDGFEIRGLKILAFPCNQFNDEEPVYREEVRQFFDEMGARFDLFDTIDVNGCDCHQLYRYMKKELPNEKTHLGVVKTNFTIFIFDKKGHSIVRLEPPVMKQVLFLNLTQYLGDPIEIEAEKVVEVKSWRKRIENELHKENSSVASKLSQKSKILDENQKAVSENLTQKSQDLTQKSQNLTQKSQDLSQRIETLSMVPSTRKSVQISSKSKILQSEKSW